METIIIDDSPHDNLQSKTAVIDLLDENSNDCVITDCSATHPFADIYRENKALGEFIDKCLSLDQFGDVLRVMNRTFVPLYKATSDDYKKSLKFERALTFAIRNIEIDPDHKFSHIRTFCQILKSEKSKRRVKLITLSKNVSGSYRRKKRFNSNRSKKPRLDNTVIDLDGDCDIRLNVSEDIPIINLDDHTVDVSEAEDLNDSTEVLQNSENADDTDYASKCEEETENAVTDSDVAMNDSEKSHVTEKHYIEIDMSECNIQVQESDNLDWQLDHIAEVRKAQRIKEIESTIASFKAMVDSLEEMEVYEDDGDDWRSPYIESGIYQKKILDLYKELCKITGDDPVKRHTVRLRASDTRSDLPMQKLEAMINKSIKSNGMPDFPDFRDVVNCVVDANEEGNLGWSRTRVMQEARVLFTHCGRALQRSRQKREWRSLLSRVKSELHDPADSDPELRARLEANHQLAQQQENDIMESFCALEKKYGMRRLNHLEDDDRDLLKKLVHSKESYTDSKNIAHKENLQVEDGPTLYDKKAVETHIENNYNAQNFEAEHTLHSDRTIETNNGKKLTEQTALTADHLVISHVFSCKHTFTNDSGNQSKSGNSSADVTKATVLDIRTVSTTNKGSNVEKNNNVHLDAEKNVKNHCQNICSGLIASSDNILLQNSTEIPSTTAQSNDDINRRLSISHGTGDVCETESLTLVYQTTTNIQVTKIEMDNDDSADICVDKNSFVNSESAAYNNSNKNEETIKTANKDLKDVLKATQHKNMGYSKCEDKCVIASNIVNGNDVKETFTGQCSVTEVNVNESLRSNIHITLKERSEARNNLSNNIIKENDSETLTELCRKKSTQNDNTSILGSDKSINALSNCFKVSENRPQQNISAKIEPIKSVDSPHTVEDGSVSLKQSIQSDDTVTPLVNVKSEADILSEFGELGPNFSVTIVNIIDPYLIVEISSDSSSEDEGDDKMDTYSNF